MTSTTNSLDDFRQKIEAAGLVPPHILEPGRRVRFPGVGKSNGNKAGWAWLSEDGQGGAFGDWSTGLSAAWHATRSAPMTAAERVAHKKRVAELQRIRHEEEVQAHAEATQRAQAIWDEALPADDAHPYLLKKQVQAHGLRVDGDGRLLVPVTINNTLTSLQFIDADGDKKFLPGGKVKGGSYTFGEPKHARTILLGEGFATVASLHEATGSPAVIAFHAGNLLAVAQALQQQYPDVTILVCGDHDESGVGQEKAQEAADAIKGVAVIPDEINTDWNDIAIRDGAETVRQGIMAAVNPTPSVSDASLKEAPWPELDSVALHGLVGDVVGLLAPHTEADPVALAVTFVSEYGCSIGRAAHVVLDGSRHPLLFWPIIVGRSSKSRKGSSERRVNSIFQRADPLWTRGECRGTLSSGEGLVNAIRDPTYKEEPDRKTGDLQQRCVDAGIVDKRLFLIQSEFGCVLRIMHREGNSLSGVLRDAWDGHDLCPMTKASPIRATQPHVAIVGHTTIDELRRNLTDIEMSNGFGNRFAYFVVKRAQEQPEFSEPDRAETDRVTARVKAALQHGRTADRLPMTVAARDAWVAIYHDLSADRPGVVGALLGRAEAQVQRLAAVYCLMDQQRQIDLIHLEAALGLWQYAEASTAHLFGHSTGDVDADNILAALRQGELSDTDISALFGYNRSRARLDQAKQILQRAGLVVCATRRTGGRPVKVWRLKEGA